MRYMLRSGLVIEEMFGKHLLIADEQARKYCRYLTELDSSAAAILKGVRENKSIDEMVDLFSEQYEDEKQEIEKIIEIFLQQMYEYNFLVKIPEKEKNLLNNAK